MLAALVGLLFLALAQEPAYGQAGGSSCLNCHEIEGEHPVLNSGLWHTQHGETVQCTVCHGGNPSQSEAGTAHAGVVRNPLDQSASRCAMCHPADHAEFAAAYQALVPPTPTATPEPIPTLAPVETEAQPGAVPAPTSTSTPPPTQTPVPVPPPPPTSPSGWLGLLAFARGPFFRFSFWFFAVGMALRLFLVLRLGWKHRRPANKPGGLAPILISFTRGLFIFPFIPRFKGVFRSSPVMYVAGGLFHLGLFGVVLFSRSHMLAWKEMLGFGWPTLPKVLIGWLAIAGLLAMLALLVNRIGSRVLRLISTPGEWLNWLLVFVPMATGWLLANRLWLSYEAMFAIHMLSVNLLLIWIPFSRISHFMFYFISRAIHGVEFERRVSLQ
jgi:hypothetical protein